MAEEGKERFVGVWVLKEHRGEGGDICGSVSLRATKVIILYLGSHTID